MKWLLNQSIYDLLTVLLEYNDVLLTFLALEFKQFDLVYWWQPNMYF